MSSLWLILGVSCAWVLVSVETVREFDIIQSLERDMSKNGGYVKLNSCEHFLGFVPTTECDDSLFRPANRLDPGLQIKDACSEWCRNRAEELNKNCTEWIGTIRSRAFFSIQFHSGHFVEPRSRYIDEFYDKYRITTYGALFETHEREITHFFFKLGTPLMKLFGISGRQSHHAEYKGEIGLYVANRTIIFFGNSSPFNTRNITFTVKDQKGDVIKDIRIRGQDSILDVMDFYQLGNGIDYEYGYVIELTRHDPSLTHLLINGNSDYTTLSERKQTFKIINDTLLSFEFYEQKYLHLYLEWKNNFQRWYDNLIDQSKNYVPKLDADAKRAWQADKYDALLEKIHNMKQNIVIIQNTEEIAELRIKVAKLDAKIDVEIAAVQDHVKELQDKIGNILDGLKKKNGDVSCSAVTALVAVPLAIIPGAGILLGSFASIVSAACAIAGV